jgi:hypothetical protein
MTIKEIFFEDNITRITFLMLLCSIIVFTCIVVTSFVITERPLIVNGYVIPNVYSENILYFPCSDKLFIKSLTKYTQDNNLEINSIGSVNKLWTKGYIVIVYPKKCP